MKQNLISSVCSHWKTTVVGLAILGIAIYRLATGKSHWNDEQQMVYYGAGLLGVFASDCDVKNVA